MEFGPNRSGFYRMFTLNARLSSECRPVRRDALSRYRRRLRPSWAVPLGGLLALSLGGVGLASITSGEIGPKLRITGNGHHLHPAGRLTTVGNFPTGSAVLPGGRFVWVVDCGHGKDDARVIRLSRLS